MPAGRVRNRIARMKVPLSKELVTDSYGIPLRVGDAVHVKRVGVRRRVLSRVIQLADGARELEGLSLACVREVFALIRRDEMARRWSEAGEDSHDKRRQIIMRYRDYQTRLILGQ